MDRKPTPFQTFVAAMAALSAEKYIPRMIFEKPDLSEEAQRAIDRLSGSLSQNPFLMDPPPPPPPAFSGYAIRDSRGRFWNGAKWVLSFDSATCMFPEAKVGSIAQVLMGRMKHTKNAVRVYGVSGT